MAAGRMLCREVEKRTVIRRRAATAKAVSVTVLRLYGKRDGSVE